MPRESSEARGSPGHILIVDDEEFIRTSFQLYFETLGFSVSTADGGKSALELFRERSQSIDVVLLDLVMPGIHGIEILRNLKVIDSSVEVIIATGCGNMNTAIQALRYGAYDYITKPIVNFEEDLLKVVQEALASRRANRQLPQSKGSGTPSTAAGAEDVGSPALLTNLEKLAHAVATTCAGDTRKQALGEFLRSQLSAVGAIAFEQTSTEKLTPLASWGEFDLPDEESPQDLPVLKAAAIVATLSEESVWQPVSPEVSTFVGCRPEEGNPPLEALLLPLDTTSAQGKNANSRLLILSRAVRRAQRAMPAPYLLALVVGQALRGATGR